MYKQHKKNQEGFTLIELLIAISVFTIGIMAAFTLALSNINTVRDNFNRVLSANLSREGLEIVRNIRDTNWLKIQDNEDCSGNAGLQICDWVNGLSAGYYYADHKDTELTSFSCNDTIDNCMSLCIDVSGSCDLYLNGGTYNHDQLGNKSSMSRIIKIENICVAEVGGFPIEDIRDSVCNEAIGEVHAGIRVSSKVRWSGANKNIDIDASELMYNWRR